MLLELAGYLNNGQKKRASPNNLRFNRAQVLLLAAMWTLPGLISKGLV